MGTMIGRVVGIKPEPEVDGSHKIEVADFASEPFEVLITPDEVTTLLQVFQRGAMERTEGRTPRFPQWAMTDVCLGYRDKNVGLLVTTDEMGTVALAGDLKVYKKLRNELDRAIDFLSGLRH